MIEITDQALDFAQAYGAILDKSAGAVVLFSGNVRNENEGKTVEKLFYETYEAMVQKVLEEICSEATQKWGLTRMDIRQRIGWIPVGQPAVLVLAAAPHRDEAFHAARYGIDELKKRAPIWKKEIYQDGSEAWVACHHHGHAPTQPHPLGDDAPGGQHAS